MVRVTRLLICTLLLMRGLRRRSKDRNKFYEIVVGPADRTCIVGGFLTQYDPSDLKCRALGLFDVLNYWVGLGWEAGT